MFGVAWIRRHDPLVVTKLSVLVVMLLLIDSRDVYDVLKDLPTVILVSMHLRAKKCERCLFTPLAEHSGTLNMP